MDKKKELLQSISESTKEKEEFCRLVYAVSMSPDGRNVDSEFLEAVEKRMVETGHPKFTERFNKWVELYEKEQEKQDKNVGKWLIDQEGKTAKKRKKPKDSLYEILEPFHTFNDKGQPNGTYDDKIAQYIIDNHQLMFLDGAPYVYNEGVYLPDKRGMIIKTLIKSMLFEKFKKDRIVNGIYSLIKDNPSVNRSMTFNTGLLGANTFPDSWVNFENGMLDIKTMEMHKNSPSYYSINQIPHKWEKNASFKDSVAHRFICGIIPNSDDRRMLYIFTGYCLTIKNDLRKALALLGPPKTGKSTLMNFIVKVVGQNNVSNLSLTTLGERFQSVALIGKTVNVCNDLSKKEIKDDSFFKQLTGGDIIGAEYKNGESFSFPPYSKIFIVCNELPPNFNDTSGAYYDRLLIIRIDEQGEYIENLKEGLEKSISGFIRVCINEYHKFLLSEKAIIDSSNSMRLVAEYQQNNDPVQKFLNECTLKAENFYERRSEMYKNYCDWCAYNDEMPFKKGEFFEIMKLKGYLDVWHQSNICYKDVKFIGEYSKNASTNAISAQNFKQVLLDETPFFVENEEKTQKTQNL